METQKIARHCFAVLVENQPGVLSRVVGMFSGRGFNIESLSVDEVDVKAKLSRITIVSNGTAAALDQVRAQLGRLVPVRNVIDMTEDGPLVERIYALLKIRGTAKQRTKAAMLAKKAGAREVNASPNSAIYEVSGAPKEIDKIVAALLGAGLVEVARSGSVALGCGDTTII